MRVALLNGTSRFLIKYSSVTYLVIWRMRISKFQGYVTLLEDAFCFQRISNRYDEERQTGKISRGRDQILTPTILFNKET